MGHSKHSTKRKIYSVTGLPQETRNISNKISNLTPKGTRKGTIKPKVNSINQSGNEQTESKKQYKMSVKPIAGSLKR